MFLPPQVEIKSCLVYLKIFMPFDVNLFTRLSRQTSRDKRVTFRLKFVTCKQVHISNVSVHFFYFQKLFTTFTSFTELLGEHFQHFLFFQFYLVWGGKADIIKIC